MYAFIITVCLLSMSGECVSYVEDPPTYYETPEECQKVMITSSNSLIKEFEEAKEQGALKGKCVYIPGIKTT